MKNNTKWNLIKVSTIGFGVISTSGIVGLVAYLIGYQEGSNNSSINKFDWITIGDAITKNITQKSPIKNKDFLMSSISNPKNDGNERSLKIDMYRGESFAKNGVLDKKHLMKLANKVNKIRMFGPEFNGLKKITLNNENIVNKDVDGIYYPGTQEIGLNSKNIEEKIVRVLDEYFDMHHRSDKKLKKIDLNNVDSYSSGIQDIIVEMLYETFYHEYGHHIFSVYTSSPNAIMNNISWISRGNSKNNLVEFDKYNKTFLNEFEAIFKYNEMKNNIGPIVEVELGSGKNARKYPTVPSSFSLSELYDNANKGLNGKVINSQQYVFTNKLNTQIKHPLLPTYVSVVYGKDLKYLYSLSELLTRKMLLSSMPQNQTSISLINGEWIKKIWPHLDFFLNDLLEKYRLTTNITSDLAKYDTPGIKRGEFFVERIGINDSYIQHNYFDDDPFLNNSSLIAKKFMDVVALTTGQKQGYNLTYIKHLNNYHVNNQNYEGDIDHKDLNKIIFGGFIPREKKYNFIGYKINDGDSDSLINEISPIEINSGTQGEENGFTYKTKLLSDRTNSNQINPKSAYWITKNYTNVNNYSGKKLYFYNKDDGGNIVGVSPLLTFRGQIENSQNLTYEEKIADIASSYIENDPYDAKLGKGKSWIAKRIGSDFVGISKS